MDKSTLADVVGAESNRGRLVLRAITLVGLVAFLAAAVFGLFEQPAEATSEDGVVHVDYPGTTRAGRNIDVVVRVQPLDCEQLQVTVNRDYLDIIDDLQAQPQAESEAAGASGEVTWTFQAADAAEVRITGRAADDWSPSVDGVITVECGQIYRIEITTWRVP